MTNEKLLMRLRELWEKHPHDRFGQLLFNHTRFGTRAKIGTVADPFHYQDDDIIQDMEEELEEEK